MKKYSFNYIPFILLCLTILSCKKDFLNVVPKTKQIAVTTNDYSLIMNHPNFYEQTYAGGWQAPALMGDDIAAEATYYNSAQAISQAAFTWADDIYQREDIVFDIRGWLSNMYAVNKVINEVMQSTGGTEQQKKAIQAEAYAERAFLNFQFVNFYGKPYVASTAAGDPAFPIITTADITNNNFTRNSVQEVYTAIVSDLTTAIANLPAANTAGAIRFSKGAAEGLLGKVYLFMGNNTAALAMFNAAFADNALAKIPARLYDYNTEFASGGKFLPITTDGPSNSPELNLNDYTESLLAKTYYNGVYGGNGFGTDFVVLSPQAAALFHPSDLRLKFYSPNFAYGQPNPSGRLAKYNSYSGPMVKYGLQISELYLLSAECKTRLNDLAGAKTDMETLRKARMPVANATVATNIASNQSALLQFIFDERVREFATKGYRWFDMRRISVDPILAKPTFTHILYKDATITNTILFTLEPTRLTLRIPISIMNANPQFTNNP